MTKTDFPLLSAPRGWVASVSCRALCILALACVLPALGVRSGGLAAADGACGSVNPLLGYGGIPYAGPWLAQHRDSRNTDFADCELSDAGYVPQQRTDIGLLHSTNVFPILSPDGTAWLTIDHASQSPDAPYLYGVDLASGLVRVRLGASHGVHRSVSWATPLADASGRIFIAQERPRAPGTPCRVPGEPTSAGLFCGAYLSFDRDGQLLWQATTDGGALGSQMTRDGKIVVQSWRGSIFVLEAETGALLHYLNAFPEAAAGLPDDLSVDALDCLFLGKGNACMVANILAVHPETGHLYNAVQGFVKNMEGAFLQRWLYDPATHKVALDPGWATPRLPGGTASSPVIDFSGDVLFVNDGAQGVYALDAESGAILARAALPYTPIGSPAIAPQLAADGSQIGTYLLFYKRWEQGPDQPPSWIVIMHYAPAEGFSVVRIMDPATNGGVGWSIVRNPIGALVDRTDLATPVRFATLAQRYCNGCASEGMSYLLVIDPSSGRVVSANLLPESNGTIVVGPDRTIVMAPKGAPNDPAARVRTLLEVYRPAN